MTSKQKKISQVFSDNIGLDDVTILQDEAVSCLQELVSEALVAKSIQKSVLEKRKNIFLSPFKDGESYNGLEVEKFAKEITEENVLSKLMELPCSIRVTNVQMLDEDLKALCLNIFNDCQLPVTINMYITPGNNKNCFLYHPDPQETFVYQAFGKKTWFIPKDKDGNKIVAIDEDYKLGLNQKDDYKFLVNSGDLVFVPYCMLHKAEGVKDELSIHFTFAFLNYFKSSFMFFMQDKAFDLIGGFEKYYQKCNDDNIAQWVEKYKENVSRLDPKQVANEFNKKINLEELKILKEGRPYSSGEILFD